MITFEYAFDKERAVHTFVVANKWIEVKDDAFRGNIEGGLSQLMFLFNCAVDNKYHLKTREDNEKV